MAVSNAQQYAHQFLKGNGAQIFLNRHFNEPVFLIENAFGTCFEKSGEKKHQNRLMGSFYERVFKIALVFGYLFINTSRSKKNEEVEANPQRDLR